MVLTNLNKIFHDEIKLHLISCLRSRIKTRLALKVTFDLHDMSKSQYFVYVHAFRQLLSIDLSKIFKLDLKNVCYFLKPDEGDDICTLHY